MSFARLWESLLPVGRDDQAGGYRRFSWTEADLACRAWFRDAAAERGLPVSADRNANLWAWWDPPGPPRPPGAIVTGSHLDSVPDGGAFDGPLGVASGFAAIDLLRARGCILARPIAVAAFGEEEGARFGVACLGSRLLTGVADPAAARALRDDDGVSLAEAMTAAGYDPALRDRVVAVLAAAGIDAPVLPTGAGHDAGVLAARVPAAMLFVRNPTGVSHAPGEHAEAADCELGVTALAAVLEDLACR
jgi:N-carbamoyl-L-amino-acid hydrolase